MSTAPGDQTTTVTCEDVAGAGVPVLRSLRRVTDRVSAVVEGD